MRLTVGAITGLLLLASCAAAQQIATVSAPRIEVDSAEYHMTVTTGFARVVIPYRFVNGADVASLNYCVNEPTPALEKQVNGSWITAVGTVMLTCLQRPPFRIERETTHARVLRAEGGLRGSRSLPQWQVGEFPGTYRLHWVLVAGSEPDRSNASRIDVTSPPFEIRVSP